MILSQPRTEHEGKVVARIDTDNFDTDLTMCEGITIRFTDGTSIILKTDWRGSSCYISQRTS